MAALEQVMQLKQQGFPESQIIQSLREQGISPKEINEALSQSKIKSEIATRQEPIVETEYPSANQMQPSIMPSESQPETIPLEEDYQYQQTSPQQYPQTYPPQYSEYQEPSYDYYQPSDIETINEIAEQIVEEKTSELKKQISSLTKLKQEIIPEIEKMNEKIEKIENIIYELQMAILRKIGEYGENIKNISSELHATQDSFSKMINPVLDKQRGTEEDSQTQEEKPRHKKKSSTNFEHYLR